MDRTFAVLSGASIPSQIPAREEGGDCANL
jgi:hypothetical protein